MAFTSEQDVGDDEDGTDCNARVRQVEDRKPADLEEVDDVAVGCAIDQVPCGARQEDRGPQLGEPVVRPPAEQEDEQSRGDDRGDGDEDGRGPGEEAERSARVVNTREAHRVAEEGCGPAEIERARRPQLEESIEQQEDGGRKKPAEAIHAHEATAPAWSGQCATAD